MVKMDEERENFFKQEKDFVSVTGLDSPMKHVTMHTNLMIPQPTKSYIPDILLMTYNTANEKYDLENGYKVKPSKDK